MGEIPSYYPLQECSTANYKIRTEANVQDSDGTLIFSYGEPEGGTALTVEYAIKHSKPCYIVNLEIQDLKKAPEEIWGWGKENNVATLNVAGPRESKKPGVQAIAGRIVHDLIEYGRLSKREAKKVFPMTHDKANLSER